MLRTPDRSHLSHACSQNSLHRSGCQVTNTHDKKSLQGDDLWGPGEQGYDSRVVSRWVTRRSG